MIIISLFSIQYMKIGVVKYPRFVLKRFCILSIDWSQKTFRSYSDWRIILEGLYLLWYLLLLFFLVKKVNVWTKEAIKPIYWGLCYKRENGCIIKDQHTRLTLSAMLTQLQDVILRVLCWQVCPLLWMHSTACDCHANTVTFAVNCCSVIL